MASNKKKSTISKKLGVKASRKSKKKKVHLRLLRKPDTSHSIFGGYPLDIYFGILYLKQKHKKTMGLHFDIKTSIHRGFTKITQNKHLIFPECIIYKCKDSIINQDIYSSDSPDNSSENVMDDMFSIRMASDNATMSSSSLSETAPSSYEYKYVYNSDAGNSNSGKAGNSNSGKAGNSNSGKSPYSFRADDFELILPENKTFIELIKSFQTISKTKTFIVIPLVFRWSCMKQFDGHANILLIDLKSKTIERFEPYGYQKSFGETDLQTTEQFDKIMKSNFSKYNYNYVKPKLFSPKKGLQLIEEHRIHKKNDNASSIRDSDPGGFCGAWSLWYADLRMSNPDIPKEKIIRYSRTLFQKTDTSLHQFIRNYSGMLIHERMKLLDILGIDYLKYNTHIEDYFTKIETKRSSLAKLLKTESSK